MTIAMVVPLAVGNAVRLFLAPPVGARKWRLLRKTADNFVGESDPAAYLVEESDDRVILDSRNLLNGAQVFYRAYYWDGSAWTPSATVVATPAATYRDDGVDVLTIVRERLFYGLQVELARGTLKHESGAIPVLTAPPVFEDTRWPCVTVHVNDDSSSGRALGETFPVDEFDEDWNEREGWLASVQLTIMAWSLNPDQRITLRQALRRIIIGNLSIFDEAGMINVEFRQQDMEDFTSYNAPVYQAMCTLTCQAPANIVTNAGVITDVIQTITAGN